MTGLLMISHSSKSTGGGEDDFHKLLSEFSGRYRVLSVFPEGERSSEFRKLSRKSAEIPDYMFPFDKFSPAGYLLYLYHCITKIRILTGFIRENRKEIDICYVNSSACLVEIFILNMLRVPYVLSVKEIVNPTVVRKILYRYFDRTALKVIVISRYLESVFTECTGYENTELVYSSVDEDLFLSVEKECKSSHIPEDNVLRIVSIGGIQPLKNQKLLLDALSEYKGKKKVSVVFAGKIIDNEYYESIKAFAEDFDKEKFEIKFAGELCKTDVIKAIVNSDCVAVTSKNEGMSIVAAEALLLGKPVLATHVGVIPEVIKDGYNGYIIDSENSYKFTEYLERLASDAELLRTLSDNCRKSYFRIFSNENFLKRHKEIIDAQYEKSVLKKERPHS